jgi:hypothetical protein
MVGSIKSAAIWPWARNCFVLPLYLRPWTDLDHLKTFCSLPLLNNDDLPAKITAARFPELMGGDSDGIVPLTSQRAALSTYSLINALTNLEPTGAAHSPSTPELGFGVVDTSGAAPVRNMVGDEVYLRVGTLLDTPWVSQEYVKGQ